MIVELYANNDKGLYCFVPEGKTHGQPGVWRYIGQRDLDDPGVLPSLQERESTIEHIEHAASTGRHYLLEMEALQSHLISNARSSK